MIATFDEKVREGHPRLSWAHVLDQAGDLISASRNKSIINERREQSLSTAALVSNSQIVESNTDRVKRVLKDNIGRSFFTFGSL